MALGVKARRREEAHSCVTENTFTLMGRGCCIDGSGACQMELDGRRGLPSHPYLPRPLNPVKAKKNKLRALNEVRDPLIRQKKWMLKISFF